MGDFNRSLFHYFNLFLISPWYDFGKNCFCKPHVFKVYGCSLILIKLSSVCFALYNDLTNSKILEKLLLSQKLIHHLTTIISSGITILTIVTSFRHHKKWKTLLQNFHHINENLDSKKKTSFRNFCYGFLLKQAIFLAFLAYLTYTWSFCFGVPLWSYIWLSHNNDLFYEFVLIHFFKTIVETMKTGYKTLHEKLLTDLNSKLSENSMRSLTQNYRLLGQTIDIFNDLFGYELFLVVFLAGVHIVNIFNFLLLTIKLHLIHNFFYPVVVSSLGLILISVVSRSNDFVSC